MHKWRVDTVPPADGSSPLGSVGAPSCRKSSRTSFANGVFPGFVLARNLPTQALLRCTPLTQLGDASGPARCAAVAFAKVVHKKECSSWMWGIGRQQQQLAPQSETDSVRVLRFMPRAADIWINFLRPAHSPRSSPSGSRRAPRRSDLVPQPQCNEGQRKNALHRLLECFR